MTTNHTPTPWTYKQTYANGAGSILAADGKGVACISAAIKRAENADNAAHIVACVNAHDALTARVAELEECRAESDRVISAYGKRVAELEAALDAARDALAKGVA